MGIILILFGVFMLTQPDNFFEYTKIRRKGRIEADPTKTDYIAIRIGAIALIIIGAVMTIMTFFA